MLQETLREIRNRIDRRIGEVQKKENVCKDSERLASRTDSKNKWASEAIIRPPFFLSLSFPPTCWLFPFCYRWWEKKNERRRKIPPQRKLNWKRDFPGDYWRKFYGGPIQSSTGNGVVFFFLTLFVGILLARKRWQKEKR